MYIFLYFCDMKDKKPKIPNPFLDSFEIEFTEMTVMVKGEKQFRQVDRSSCVKVFLDDGVREVRAGLSLRGKELLLYLIDNIGGVKDTIKLSPKRLMNSLGIKSILTVRKGVMELKDRGIIAYAGVRGLYYINPVHFFRGSRVSMYPDNVRKYLTARQREWEEKRAAQGNYEPLPFDNQ